MTSSPHHTTPQPTRDPSWQACAEHVLVDSHPGLLIAQADGLAFVPWAQEPGSMEQAWVEAGRVQKV